MLIDVDTPDSPGWWLTRLDKKLHAKRKRLDVLYARYDGNGPLPQSLASAPEAARQFFTTSRTNFAEMVVKTVRYRLRCSYITTSRSDGETGDVEAWKVLRRAGLPDEEPDIIRNMLVAGDGFGMVSRYEGKVAATSEDPRQVVTIHDPLRQSVIRAGAKFFRDADEGIDYAYLHRPGRVWVARYVGRSGGNASTRRFNGRSWEWDPTRGGEAGQEHPGGQDFLGIVRYRNDEAIGDYERHASVLDRIDHVVLQGMVIVTLQAFRQRAIKVDPIEMPDVDPGTGEDIDYNDVLSADPGALWKLPKTAEMWESGAVDVTPITTMVTKEVERLSAVTFTPMSAFTPEGANQSAQGASLIKEGAVFKAEDKQRRVAAGHARMASMIFRLAGLDVGDPEDLVIGWAPAERYGLTERYQAAVSAKAAGVPWRTIMRDVLGFSPEQVDRMSAQRFEDLVLLPQAADPSLAATDASSS